MRSRYEDESTGNSVASHGLWRTHASVFSALTSAIILILLLGAVDGVSLLALDREAQLVAVGSAIAFLFGWVIGRSPLIPQSSWLGQFLRIAVISAVTTQPILLVVIFLDIDVSRLTLLFQLAAVVGLLFVTIWRLPGWIPVTATASMLLAVSMLTVRPAAEAPAVQFISTSYHDLKLNTYEIQSQPPTDGGAVHLLTDGRVLLVNAEGGAHLLTVDGTRIADHTVLNLNIPINREEYIESGGPRPFYFRVVDIFVVERLGGASLLSTYSYWDASNRCYTLRLSIAPWAARGDVKADAWRTLFESEPCIKVPRNTNEHGGRMALLSDDTLLFSIGSHKLESNDPETLVNSVYGQIRLLNLRTGETELYSDGHRNVQGLWVGQDEIWVTEHGPYGGDELNLLKKGKHYGWPFASYGTDYTGKTLEHGDVGVHAGFERPIYAWTPSIAISNLIRTTSPQFPLWHGDLLVGSLFGKGNGVSIYRVRVREGRMVSSERIPVGSTIRDLLELPSGRLLLWDGKGTVSIIEGASHIFASCAGCHATRSNVLGIGPSLHGIVGAPVARQAAFPYSDAMRAYGGKWTERRLHAFLADPDGVVPGTTMEHAGIVDEPQRQEIIEYLRDISD